MIQQVIVSLCASFAHPRHIRAVLLALGTAFAFSAAAQTPTESQPTESKQDAPVLDVVDVAAPRSEGYTAPEAASATKLDLSPRETPQSMTIMTRERLDDQNLKSMRQVLDNTPGIYSNAYDTERVLFYSRGFLVDTLMYDGVPTLPNSSTQSIDENIDTAAYERIEIVRGATGLMSGAGNPAASVNLVRKHADSKTPTISLDLTAGSWHSLRAAIDASMPLNSDGSVRGRFVAVADDSESYQALYEKRKYVLYGIIDADLSADTRVSVGFDYQDNRANSNTWGSFPLFLSNGHLQDWPISVTTATDWTYWNKKTESVFAELKHTFDNGWLVHSILSTRRFREDLELFFLTGDALYGGSFPDPTTGLGLAPFVSKSDGKIVENELDVYASGPFQLAGRKHDLIGGFTLSHAKNTGNEAAPVSALATPGNFFEWDGSFPRPEFGPATPSTDITTKQGGVYGAARFSVADPLHFIAGARYAWWKVDSFYIYDNPINSEYDFTEVVPYTGLVWDFLPQYSAFASYTGIFKPQNYRDTGGHYLDPIDGRSFELGIKGEHFDRQLNTAVTVFETLQNNVAVAALDAGGNPILLPDGSSASQSADGIRTRGIEVELAGRLTSELQASLGWTYYQIEDAEGEKARTFIPSTLLRAFATWEPRRLVEHLTLGAGVNWQSSTRMPVASPSGPTTLKQSSVATVAVMARYQFTPDLSIQFNGNNIFDKKYYVLDEFDNTYYGAPANYTVTMRVTY
jgi:outer membrane receptor for ferric coprogen and ferric-rhodotorulic acid